MPINTRTVLVVGGAGFIGSHMVLKLEQAGFQPVVLDNLKKGHRDAVIGAELIVGDIADKELLTQLFTKYQFCGVMHFASFIDVRESFSAPLSYYQNNLAGTINLLDVMLKHNVKKLVFSSTAAVYGQSTSPRLSERTIAQPMNPYGRSKWMAEEIIRDLANSHDFHYAILRYFNAAGADPQGRLGERHEPESHLIPLALQVAAGKRPEIKIYGNHYPTFDGTCLRDYIHVSDLCSAHLLALNTLLKNKKNVLYNVGTGHGYSVLQVIKAVQRVTRREVRYVVAPPRPNEVASLVADPSLIEAELAWKPSCSNLDTIITHAWQFTKKMLL